MNHITDITFRKSQFQVYDERIEECPRLKNKLRQELSSKRRALCEENEKFVRMVSESKPSYSVKKMNEDFLKQSEYSARISQNSGNRVT